MQIKKKETEGETRKITKFRRPAHAIVQKPAARLPVSVGGVATFGTLSLGVLWLVLIYLLQRVDIVKHVWHELVRSS